MKDRDFINIEILESLLDYVTNDIKSQIKKTLVYDYSIEDYIEKNRFERMSTIIANYYNRKFNGGNISQELISLLYSSLINPYFITNRSDLASVDNVREAHFSTEGALFNNNIYDWFDYYGWKINHHENLLSIVRQILFANENLKRDELAQIDIAVYREILSNKELAQSINWRNFELLLAKILEKCEYDVEVLKGSKDGGIDVIALKKDSSFGSNRYLIQAKKWSNKVGVTPVRELLWAHNEYKVTKSCLVTTSEFTKGAWELAEQHKWQIELKDYDKLIEWIDEASV